MPIEYVTLECSGTGNASVDRFPKRILVAAVTSVPKLVKLPQRALLAIAVGSSNVTVTKLVSKVLTTVAGSLAKMFFKRSGAGWASIVTAERKWSMSEVPKWSVHVDPRFTFTTLGD